MVDLRKYALFGLRKYFGCSFFITELSLSFCFRAFVLSFHYFLYKSLKTGKGLKARENFAIKSENRK